MERFVGLGQLNADQLASLVDRRQPVMEQHYTLAQEAWAAFRLFLRCVDRRFYLWREAMKTSMPDLPRLWQHQLALNDQDIRHAVERNEERLAETLFGLRISRDEIAPWYRTPPTVDVE